MHVLWDTGDKGLRKAQLSILASNLCNNVERRELPSNSHSIPCPRAVLELTGVCLDEENLCSAHVGWMNSDVCGACLHLSWAQPGISASREQ